jgi:hypothetical protein
MAMNDAKLQNERRERLWRWKLTDAERTELRAQPETAAELELESRLSQALAKLPDAAVPSNFTARVLQAVELEESRRSHRRHFGWNWHALLPRIAVTAAMVLFAGLTVHHHELTTRRTALVRSVALAAGSQPLPSVDALKNFDAIQRMSQPRADEELLALMR